MLFGVWQQKLAMKVKPKAKLNITENNKQMNMWVYLEREIQSSENQLDWNRSVLWLGRVNEMLWTCRIQGNEQQ